MVIIITGPAAIGKTHRANEIAKKYSNPKRIHSLDSEEFETKGKYAQPIKQHDLFILDGIHIDWRYAVAQEHLKATAETVKRLGADLIICTQVTVPEDVKTAMEERGRFNVINLVSP